MKFDNLGMLCLVVFLILTGVMIVTNLQIAFMATIRGITALAAGFLLLFNK